jgi:hypothetical protein
VLLNHQVQAVRLPEEEVRLCQELARRLKELHLSAYLANVKLT